MTAPTEAPGGPAPTPRDLANSARRKLGQVAITVRDYVRGEIPGPPQVNVPVGATQSDLRELRPAQQARANWEAKMEDEMFGLGVDAVHQTVVGLISAVLDVADSIREQTDTYRATNALQRGRAESEQAQRAVFLKAREYLDQAEVKDPGSREHGRALGLALEQVLIAMGLPEIRPATERLHQELDRIARADEPAETATGWAAMMEGWSALMKQCPRETRTVVKQLEDMEVGDFTLNVLAENYSIQRVSSDGWTLRHVDRDFGDHVKSSDIVQHSLIAAADGILALRGHVVGQ